MTAVGMSRKSGARRIENPTNRLTQKPVTLWSETVTAKASCYSKIICISFEILITSHLIKDWQQNINSFS
jgi:hypothetical protein